MSLFAADPVDADRLPYGGTWLGKVGVQDVTPSTRTKHNVSTANGGDDATGTMQTGCTSAQIAAALAAAESAGGERYVEMEEGTFSLSATLSIASDSVTLRGQTNASGIPTTILSMAAGTIIEIKHNDFNYDSALAFGGTDRVVSSGFSRGSTTVVLTAAPTGLTAGRLMWFSASANSDIDGESGFTDWYPDDGNEPFSQVVKVTAVNSSTVDFTPAINADYVTGTINVHYKTAASQIDYVGLENLKIVNATGFFADNIIELKGGNQCWFNNIWTIGVGDDNDPGLNVHLYFKLCYNSELKHSRMEDSVAVTSSSYAIASVHSSGLLIVNNSFTDLPNVYPVLSTSGSVFAYNYATNEPYTIPQWLSQGVFYHGSHCHYNLFEGNWLYTHFHDESNAGNYSHSRNSLFFRQRLTGWDANGSKTANTHCITLQNHHDNVTVAGCVMGWGSIHIGYDGNGSTTGTDGYGYIFNSHTTSDATLERFGNYNYYDDAIPAGEAIGGGDALVTSYIYSSKPDWFGDRPWPWVDPTNISQSNDPENLPAGYRFINGEDPPAEGGGGDIPSTSGTRSLGLRLKR